MGLISLGIVAVAMDAITRLRISVEKLRQYE
jgi:hypothetical protein